MYYISGQEYQNMNLYTMKTNGTGKKTIDTDIGNLIFLVNTDCLLNPSGGYIYYGKDGTKKYSLSTGKISSASNSVYFNVAGKYAYTGKGDTGTSAITLSRYDLDRGEKAAKKVITLKKDKNYSYSISNICQVGNYIYIDLDVRYFDEHTNWHGEYRGIETYKMTTSFKNVKKLN